MSKDYTIGIYIRLSMADEDTGTGNKAESDSIGNQRMLINRYLDKHPMLSKYPRLEFVGADLCVGLCGNAESRRLCRRGGRPRPPASTSRHNHPGSA